MPRFQAGDYVKAEFKDEATGESEWMWVVVDSCDDGAGVLFGRLDNEPVVGTGLDLGDELAVRYDKVVEHRMASEFQKQEGAADFQPQAGHRLMGSLVANRQDVVQLQRYPHPCGFVHDIVPARHF